MLRTSKTAFGVFSRIYSPFGELRKLIFKFHFDTHVFTTF
jgi:hypothetical protein